MSTETKALADRLDELARKWDADIPFDERDRAEAAGVMARTATALRSAPVAPKLLDSQRGALTYIAERPGESFILSRDDAAALGRLLAAASPVIDRDDEPRCPGPNCLACSGEACGKCGAGCWNDRPGRAKCEHDVIERHEGRASSGEPEQGAAKESLSAMRARLSDGVDALCESVFAADEERWGLCKEVAAALRVFMPGEMNAALTDGDAGAEAKRLRSVIANAVGAYADSGCSAADVIEILKAEVTVEQAAAAFAKLAGAEKEGDAEVALPAPQPQAPGDEDAVLTAYDVRGLVSFVTAERNERDLRHDSGRERNLIAWLDFIRKKLVAFGETLPPTKCGICGSVLVDGEHEGECYEPCQRGAFAVTTCVTIGHGSSHMEPGADVCDRMATIHRAAEEAKPTISAPEPSPPPSAPTPEPASAPDWQTYRVPVNLPKARELARSLRAAIRSGDVPKGQKIVSAARVIEALVEMVAARSDGGEADEREALDFAKKWCSDNGDLFVQLTGQELVEAFALARLRVVGRDAEPTEDSLAEVVFRMNPPWGHGWALNEECGPSARMIAQEIMRALRASGARGQEGAET